VVVLLRADASAFAGLPPSPGFGGQDGGEDGGQVGGQENESLQVVDFPDKMQAWFFWEKNAIGSAHGTPLHVEKR
jgi:hypothetical protein